jgi:hypothetical protein
MRNAVERKTFLATTDVRPATIACGNQKNQRIDSNEAFQDTGEEREKFSTPPRHRMLVLGVGVFELDKLPCRHHQHHEPERYGEIKLGRS